MLEDFYWDQSHKFETAGQVTAYAAHASYDAQRRIEKSFEDATGIVIPIGGMISSLFRRD